MQADMLLAQDLSLLSVQVAAPLPFPPLATGEPT